MPVHRANTTQSVAGGNAFAYTVSGDHTSAVTVSFS